MDHETTPQDSCRTLGHDDCVVCSDTGIPLRVVAFEGDDALCEDAAGTRAEIAVELVAPVEVGDVLLTHAGVAIGRARADIARHVASETSVRKERS